MAWSRVGGSGAQRDPNTTGFTVTYTATAGNLLLIPFACGNGVNDPIPTALVDNHGNALTISACPLSSDKQRAGFGWYTVPVGGATSFTASGSNAGTYFEDGAIEFTGGANTLDNSQSSTGADPLTTTGMTNSDPNALVLGICVSDDNAASSWASVTGWTQEWQFGDSSTGTPAQVVYQIASSNTGPFSAVFHYLAATTSDAAFMISFKQSSGGGSPTVHTLMMLGMGN